MKLLSVGLFIACASLLTPCWANGFTTVVDAPPTVIGNGELYIDDTQINILPNAMVGDFVRVGTSLLANNEVNVNGGSIGQNYSQTGGTLNVDSGAIGNSAFLTSVDLNMSGGELGNSVLLINGGSAKRSTASMSGGVIGDFFATEASPFVMSGGEIGDSFSTSGGNVVLNGGSIGNRFLNIAPIEIFSGSIGDFFDSNNDTELHGGAIGNRMSITAASLKVTGGTIGDGFLAQDARLTISGGEFGDRVQIFPDTTVDISGGTFGADFDVVGNDFVRDSSINLFGVEFFIDGMPVGNLIPDQPFEVTTRGGSILSGRLEDGSAFSFELNETDADGSDYFDPRVPLTITLIVPEPTTLGLLLCVAMSAVCYRSRL